MIFINQFIKRYICTIPILNFDFRTYSEIIDKPVQLQKSICVIMSRRRHFDTN